MYSGTQGHSLDPEWADMSGREIGQDFDMQPNTVFVGACPQESQEDANYTATDQVVDEDADYEPPVKKAARGRKSSTCSKKPTRTQIRKEEQKRDANTQSVYRYRDRKRQANAELEENIAKAAAEVQSLKLEQEQLSFTEQAMTKMIEYAQELLETIRSTLGPVLPAALYAPSEDQKAAANWIEWLPRLPFKTIRNAILKGAILIPPEAVIRYRLKTVSIENFHRVRSSFVDRIQSLLKEWRDGDEESRLEIEQILEPLFKLQARTAKAIAEERPDLLHSLMTLSPNSYKSPEEIQQLVLSLELTAAQQSCLGKLYQEQIASVDEMQVAGNMIQSQCQILQRDCYVKDTLKAMTEDQAMLLVLLRDTKFLTMKTTDVFFVSSVTLIRELTAVQKAAILTFYYPGVPDVTALLKAIYDTWTSHILLEVEIDGALIDRD